MRKAGTEQNFSPLGSGGVNALLRLEPMPVPKIKI